MESDLGGALIRIIVCLPIIGIIAYLFIKFGLAKNYSRNKGHMKIIEQVVLLPKVTLNIVKVENEYLLLGATEKEIILIKQLDNYEEIETAEFQFHLTEALKRFSKGSDRHG